MEIKDIRRILLSFFRLAIDLQATNTDISGINSSLNSFIQQLNSSATAKIEFCKIRRLWLISVAKNGKQKSAPYTAVQSITNVLKLNQLLGI